MRLPASPIKSLKAVLRSFKVKGHCANRMTSTDPIIVCPPLFEIFDCNFNGLKLGEFKVIQG